MKHYRFVLMDELNDLMEVQIYAEDLKQAQEKFKKLKLKGWRVLEIQDLSDE